MTAAGDRAAVPQLVWLGWLTAVAGAGIADLGLLTADYLPSTITALAFELIAAGVTGAALLTAARWFRPQLVALAVFHLLGVAFSASLVGEAVRQYGGKLAALHYAGYNGVPDVYPFYALLVSLITLSALPVFRSEPAQKVVAPTIDRRALSILLTVGAIGLGLTLSESRADAFANRGDSSSDGAITLAYWAAAVAVAYLLAQGELTRPMAIYWAAGATEVFALLMSANRTPLILIGCALLYRLSARVPRAMVVLLPGLTLVGTVVASYLSVWRGQIRDGLPSDPVAVVRVISSDPIGSFLNIGLDSVDGYYLAGRLVNLGFAPQPLDPLIAVLNFVPRALWAAKPTLLGSRIGVDYLGFTSGGIFLSGPGYLALVSGSVVLGAVLFVVVLAAGRYVAAYGEYNPCLAVTGLFFSLNFIVAGDAFNLFLALQAALLWLGAGAMSRTVAGALTSRAHRAS